MRITIMKQGVYVVITLLFAAGILGACSTRAPQSNNGGSSTMTTSSSSTGSAATVNVVTSEMKITFESQATHAGKITFQVKNQGKIEHNFELEGNGINYKTKMIPPGGTETFTADLPPGQYDFYCAVPGHAIAGMHGSFTLG